MSQTVFNNEMALHVWAQRSQPYGRNSNDTISFDGGTLNSYSTSIALHYGDFVLSAEPSQFSVTTNRHTPSRYDVSPARIIYLSDFFRWGHKYHYKNQYPKGGEIKKSLVEELKILAIEYAKKKRDSTRQRVIYQIHERLEDLSFICKRFNMVYPYDTEHAEDFLQLADGIIEKARKAEKARIAKHKRAMKKKREEFKQEFDDFLNGASRYFPNSYRQGNNHFITVYNGEVLTSGGATAPLEHVKKAFKLYRRVIATGKEWRKNGEQCRLGHFNLDFIDKAGNAVAGCHHFKAEELKRFSEKWEI